MTVSGAPQEPNSGSTFPPPGPSLSSPPLAKPSVSSALGETSPLPSAAVTQPLRPGQVTVAWQIMLAVCWGAAFFAFLAVWKTSEEIGIGTWWLGPRAQPQPMLVRVLPFAITLSLGFLAISNMRRVALVSIAGSLTIAGIAVFDMTRSGGLAAIEFAIAGSMLLVSCGALVASARRAPVPAPPD